MPGDIEKLAEDDALQTEHDLNIAAYNRLNNKPLYDGTLDRFGEIRLRLAVIANPEIGKTADGYKELEVDKHVNLNTGKVNLKWEDMPGGIIRDKDLDGEWKKNTEGDSINPEERESSGQDTTSEREMVDLTSPFVWTGGTNWCGMNYIPPVGSRVIVGFRKHGFPLILGYLPADFTVMKPILKPGETCIKGYGNNYAHFRWSDKLDLKAWTGEGNPDPDDPNGEKTSGDGTTIWIRLNANDGYLRLSVGGKGGGSAINMTSNDITITTGTYNLQVRDLINIDSPKITQN